MEALEIFAYFAGTALLICAFGYLYKCFNGPNVTIHVPEDNLPPIPTLDERMKRYGFTRETPMWTYKETTKYFPNDEEAKTTPEQESQPKEKN